VIDVKFFIVRIGIQSFDEKTDRKRPSGRFRLRWQDHIKIELEENEREVVDLIYLVCDSD
jgi:hypothetical protein